MKASPKNSEAQFEIDELFFSITDKKGIIQNGNDVFARVAQFSLNELIGSPHNIIRHPDMPKSVFRLLWQTIQSNKPIAAYVKNMSRDGSYYWVLAFVIPIGERYLSVRIKPSSDIFKLIPELYRKMQDAEHSKGIDAGEAVLTSALEKLGYSDYFSFMRTMVTTEMKSRDAILEKRASARTSLVSQGDVKQCELVFRLLHSESAEVGSLFRDLFGRLGVSDRIGDEMYNKAKFFLDFSTRIKFLALNANLGAQRLGSSGKTLAVVAGQIQRTSFDTIGSIRKMSDDLRESVGLIRDTGFQISAARLLLEMAEFFTRESVEQGRCRSDNEGWLRSAYENMELLSEAMRVTSEAAVHQLRALSNYLRQVSSSLNSIVEVNASVGIVHITGRTEAAQANAVEEFEKTFDDLQTMVGQSKRELNLIVSGMNSIHNELQGLEGFESTVSTRLKSFGHRVQELEKIQNTAQG